MTEIKLKHCPFCGPGQSMVDFWEDHIGYWRITCGACGSSSGTMHPNNPRAGSIEKAKEIVANRWNHRPIENMKMGQFFKWADRLSGEKK